MKYEVKYHCSNCQQGLKKKFQRGSAAPRVIVCSHCGLKTARKEEWWTTDSGERVFVR